MKYASGVPSFTQRKAKNPITPRGDRSGAISDRHSRRSAIAIQAPTAHGTQIATARGSTAVVAAAKMPAISQRRAPSASRHPAASGMSNVSL